MPAIKQISTSKLLEYGDHEAGLISTAIGQGIAENDLEIVEMTISDFHAAIKTLADHKADKAAELEAACIAALEADVTYDSVVYQNTERTVKNLVKLTVHRAAGGTLKQGFTWRAKDNSDVPFTFTDIDGLIKIIGVLTMDVEANMTVRKNELIAAADIAAVNAITWS